MNDIEQYIRVGTDYYRIVEIPLTYDKLKVLKKWNRQTIIDDYSKSKIDEIAKYKGFCIIPSHIQFERVINGFYNKYEPLSYKPIQNGKWEKIESFLKHIFGEQYLLGLDYLTLLWRKPTQVLPILCLVSIERNTGKTTFLNLLKLIFEGNMTLNTNEDFRSRFNSDWLGKLLVAIDEVLLDREEDSERIKNLSTARYYKSEAKGKDREEVEFFGKFILCSNKEENFVKLDSNEIRYWVRKIPVLQNGSDTGLLDAMKKEIPSFTYFLSNREMETAEKSRMWFTKEQIYTDALKVLIQGNKTTLEKEIEELILDELAFFEKEELCYTAQNIVEMLSKRNVKVNNNYVKTILNDKFNLVYEKNSSYQLYRSDHSNPEFLDFTNQKGRFYRFTKDVFDEKLLKR
jgi:hypothetical protein